MNYSFKNLKVEFIGSNDIGSNDKFIFVNYNSLHLQFLVLKIKNHIQDNSYVYTCMYIVQCTPKYSNSNILQSQF